METYYLKLRVFFLEPENREEELGQLLTDLEQRCDKVIWCVEDDLGAARPHVHFLLHTTKQAQTIRKYLKGTGYEGNKYYSISHAEEEWPVEYLAYMLKQRDEPEPNIFDYDYSAVPAKVLKKIEKYNAQVQAEIEEKKAKKKKAKKKPIIEQIEEYYDNYTDVESDGTYCDETYKLQNAIIDYHVENGLLLRRFQCQSYFFTIIARRQLDRQALRKHLFE